MPEEVIRQVNWLRARDVADRFDVSSSEFNQNQGKAILRAAAMGAIATSVIKFTVNGESASVNDAYSLGRLFMRASSDEVDFDWENGCLVYDNAFSENVALGVKFSANDLAEFYSEFDVRTNIGPEDVRKLKATRSPNLDQFAAGASVALELNCLSKSQISESTGESVGEMLREWYAANGIPPYGPDNLRKAGDKILAVIRKHETR